MALLCSRAGSSRKRLSTSLPYPSWAQARHPRSWSTTAAGYLWPLSWLVSSMPARPGPSKREAPLCASTSSQALPQMPPTPRHPARAMREWAGTRPSPRGRARARARTSPTARARRARRARGTPPWRARTPGGTRASPGPWPPAAWSARGRGTRTSGRRSGTPAVPSCAAPPTRRSRRPRSPRPPRRSSQARGHTVEPSPCVRLPLPRMPLARWNPTGEGRRAAPYGAAPVNPTCLPHVSWAKRSVVTHTNYRRARFRPFSSVAVRIRKRPAQTSFCIRQLSLVFVPWYPSQGGDHQFESGTGYQKSAGQSIVFGLFCYLGVPFWYNHILDKSSRQLSRTGFVGVRRVAVSVASIDHSAGT